MAFYFIFCLEVNKNTKITENLWRNFWRDKWRSVFDVVQNFRFWSHDWKNQRIDFRLLFNIFSKVYYRAMQFVQSSLSWSTISFSKKSKRRRGLEISSWLAKRTWQLHKVMFYIVFVHYKPILVEQQPRSLCSLQTFSSNLKNNPVHQTRNFENVKNQVQIDRKTVCWYRSRLKKNIPRRL